MKLYPELTYIPLDYANSSIANLVIHGKDKQRNNPQIKEPFFIFWLPLNNSEDVLVDSITNMLPKFPVKKSITCTINLAYPIKFIQQDYPDYLHSVSTQMVLGQTIAKIVPLRKSLDFLCDLPLVYVDTYSQLECSSSMYFWSLLTKLTMQLIAKGNYIPHVHPIEKKQGDNDFYQDKIGSMKTEWIPVLKSERDFQNFIRIQQYASISSHNLPVLNKCSSKSEYDIPPELTNVLTHQGKLRICSEILSTNNISRDYLENVLDRVVRMSFTSNQEQNEPESWDKRVIQSLTSDSGEFDIYEVKEEIIPDIFDKWSQRLNLFWDLNYSLKFVLNTPDSIQKEDAWTLDFFLHSLSNESLDIELKDFWEVTQNVSLKQDYFQESEIFIIREYILKTFNVLSKIFSPLYNALKQKYPEKIILKMDKTIELLQSGMHIIKSYGYSVEIPKSFALGGTHRIQPVLTIDSSDQLKGERNNAPFEMTSFDISSVLRYEWILKIGDKVLSEDEITQLLKAEENETLLFRNNQWIMVNKNDLTHFHKRKSSLVGTITGENALKLALTQNAYLKQNSLESYGPYPVQFYGPLDDVMKMIKGQVDMPHLPQPSSFNGILRKYQEYGFNWLRILTSIGFGCVLADDMGLGKTIQVIALILSILQNNPEKNNKFLVVCPTSVLGNWKREINKFAPTIKVKLHYGPSRSKNINSLLKFIQDYDVILTSYNILRRDIDILELVKWESVILDESQNIKNYKTKQAKAAYRLVEKTRRKIALSGTPIENRITELWSLYHFVNPFLLGKRSQFMKRYAIPVGRLGNETLTTELSNLINPFLLRRMKTNKDIIPELPDKQETEVYIQLTTDQKKFYKSVVDKMLYEVESLRENSKQKFKQKGLILKALMQLKQICNHPDQFLHIPLEKIKETEIDSFISKSSKIQRILELLEEAIASKSKVLVFTQFKVMGDFLKYVLESYFHLNIPFIHGGVPQEVRTNIVTYFQEEDDYDNPILLLSLRAGGVGLNLSKASVVLHFDRWWNPAVEDQATDRAYRIGQKNKVNVYKMVSEGTIEERISAMLKEKRALAERVIKVTGEEWITELSFGELKDMFQLEEVTM